MVIWYYRPGQRRRQGIGSDLRRSSIVFCFLGRSRPPDFGHPGLPRGRAARIVMLMPKVILLLIGSNVFMTIAWYGHLKFKWLEGRPLIVAILIAWGVAFFEYCLQVPAHRLGYFSGEFSGYQLKII